MNKSPTYGVAFYAIALILTGLTSLALRLAFFSGYILSDDAFYIGRVLELVSGELTPPTSYFGARLGLVGPAALAVKTLGPSKLSMVLWPLLCSTFTPLVAYALAARLFDRRVALLTAVLLACYPLEVIFASHLFACTPQALLIGGALACWLTIRSERDRGRALAAGALIGAACVVQETSIFVLVFVLPDWWLRRPPLALLGWAALGLLLVLALDPLWNGALFGDPFLRLRLIADNDSLQGTAVDIPGAGANLRWILSPWLRVFSEQELALYPLAALPALAFGLRRDRPIEHRALALFAVSVFLWFCYGSLSPTYYAPLPHLPRYLAPLTVPVAILLAAWIMHFRSSILRAGLAALLCSTGLLGAALDDGRAVPAPFDALYAHLRANPPPRLIVDQSSEAPLWLASRGQPPAPLARLVDEDLSEVREVWPVRGAVRPFDTARDRLVAARSPTVQQALREHSGASLLARFESPNNFHARVLRHPLTLRILSLGRDSYRMEDLRSRAHTRPSVELYRLAP